MYCEIHFSFNIHTVHDVKVQGGCSASWPRTRVKLPPHHQVHRAWHAQCLFTAVHGASGVDALAIYIQHQAMRAAATEIPRRFRTAELPPITGRQRRGYGKRFSSQSSISEQPGATPLRYLLRGLPGPRWDLRPRCRPGGPARARPWPALPCRGRWAQTRSLRTMSHFPSRLCV